MNIIAISNQIPSIEKKGYQLVSFSRLAHLANLGCSIQLVCFGNLKNNEDYKARRILEKKGIQVHFVQWSILESAWNLLKAIYQPTMPFQCALYKSAKFSKTINQLFENTKADSIYCIMLFTGIFPSKFYCP